MQLGVVGSGGSDFTSPVGLLCAHLPKHVRIPTGAVVFAWGVNEDGQLGLDERVNVGVPTVVHDFLGVQLAGRSFYRSPLVGGSRNTLAIDGDGQVWSWGWNDRGTLGHGHRQPVSKPQRLTALNGIRVVQVAVNGWHCLAVSDQGQMYAWGGNEYQQCGVDPEKRDVLLPTPCLPQLKVRQVACGGMHSLALTEDGNVWTWGEPWGDFSLHAERRPRPVPGAVGMAAIAAGAFHNMALSQVGEVYTWGTNDYGQLGNGHTTYDTQPRRVVDMEGILVSDIAAGGWHSLALSVHGEVYTWGRGEYGRLGIGDTTGSSKLRAHKVRGLEGQVIVQVCAGGTHTLALGADGRLWSWGRASFGRLGSATAAHAAAGKKEQDAYTPVEVCLPGGTARWSVVAVTAGGRHSMCLALPIHERPVGISPAASENGALLSDSVEGGSEASLFCRDSRADGVGNGHTGEDSIGALPAKPSTPAQQQAATAPRALVNNTQEQMASFANLLPMDQQQQPPPPPPSSTQQPAAAPAPAHAQRSGSFLEEGISVSSSDALSPLVTPGFVAALPGLTSSADAMSSVPAQVLAAHSPSLSVLDAQVAAAVNQLPPISSSVTGATTGALPGSPSPQSSLVVNPMFEPSTATVRAVPDQVASPINIPVALVRGDSNVGSPALSSPGANEQYPATLAGEVLAGSADASLKPSRHSSFAEDSTEQVVTPASVVVASDSIVTPPAGLAIASAPDTAGTASGSVTATAPGAGQPVNILQANLPATNLHPVRLYDMHAAATVAPSVALHSFPLSIAEASAVPDLVMGASGDLGSLPSIEFSVAGLGGNSPRPSHVLVAEQAAAHAVGRGAWDTGAVGGARPTSGSKAGSTSTSPTRCKPHGMSVFIQAPDSAANAAAAGSNGEAGATAAGMEGLVMGPMGLVRTASPLSRASSRVSLASSSNSPRHAAQANHMAATAASMIGAGMTRTGSAGYNFDIAEGSDAGGMDREAERDAGQQLHEAGVAGVVDDSRPPPGAVLDAAWTTAASDMHELVDKSMEHEEDVEKWKAQRRAARHQLQQLKDSNAAAAGLQGASEDGAGSACEAGSGWPANTADGAGSRDDSEDDDGADNDDDDDDDGISSTSRMSFHAADGASLARPMSPSNPLHAAAALRARGVVASGVAGSPTAASHMLQPSLSINTGAPSPIRASPQVEQAAMDVAARLAAAVVGSPRGAYNGTSATLFTDMLLGGGSGAGGNNTGTGRSTSSGPTLMTVTSAPNTARATSAAAALLPATASTPVAGHLTEGKLQHEGVHGSPFGEPVLTSTHAAAATPVPESPAGSYSSEGAVMQLMQAVNAGSEAGSTRSLGRRSKSRDSARVPPPRVASPAPAGVGLSTSLPPAAMPVISSALGPLADLAAANRGNAGSARLGVGEEEVHDALMASLGPPSTASHGAAPPA